MTELATLRTWGRCRELALAAEIAAGGTPQARWIDGPVGVQERPTALRPRVTPGSQSARPRSLAGLSGGLSVPDQSKTDAIGLARSPAGGSAVLTGEEAVALGGRGSSLADALGRLLARLPAAPPLVRDCRPVAPGRPQLCATLSGQAAGRSLVRVDSLGEYFRHRSLSVRQL